MDSRDLVPEGATDVREFSLVPDRLAWSILYVELEEFCGTAVTIRVGDYVHETTGATAWDGSARP